VPKQQTVLIDGTAIPSQLGGVGRYLEGLTAGLSSLGFPFHLVLRAEHVEHFRSLAPLATIHTAPRPISRTPVRFLWEQTGLVRLARRLRVGVLHSPHYTFPLVTGLRRVVTLHDATFFTDPAAHTPVKRAFFAAWIRLALRRRLACVVPSLATARELTAVVPAARAELTVAHHGVDRDVFRPPTPDEVAAVRAALGLADADEWIAFLGTIEPRKNVGNLLRAHAALRAERPGIPTLVIAGARGWDADANAELDRLGPADGVLEAGYLPLNLLAALLGGAQVVAYPSVAEGFGLPVLEAMASGACVLTTARTALPEVGGDAVAYAEPDAASLQAALGALLSAPAERERLAGLALDRAAGFTWEACAAHHLEAYGRAM
jgi:glycosyltransferase involved in cell wall biosynthesis